MKKITLIAAACFGIQLAATAQLAPAPSPLAKIEQKVGLTDVSIQYSRPAKNNRVIFGDLVPYNEIWRTGANENTKITFSDPCVIGKDTLKAGTYALYTKPGKDSWEVIFYSDFSNWGTPDTWDDKKVSLKYTAKPADLASTVESFTLSIDAIEMGGAKLNITWDKTQVTVPFTVPTDKKVTANIKKAMGGPTAGDYYASAQYYLNTKKDTKQALEWINKGIEMNPNAYWMVRTKALIQAEMGDKTGAVTTAQSGRAIAEKDGNKDYVKMFDESIATWKK